MADHLAVAAGMRAVVSDVPGCRPRNERWGVEVKAAATSAAELRGLAEFRKLHPDFEPCLVSLVPHKFEGVRSLEAEEILGLSRM